MRCLIEAFPTRRVTVKASRIQSQCNGSFYYPSYSPSYFLSRQTAPFTGPGGRSALAHQFYRPLKLFSTPVLLRFSLLKLDCAVLLRLFSSVGISLPSLLQGYLSWILNSWFFPLAHVFFFVHFFLL